MNAPDARGNARTADRAARSQHERRRAGPDGRGRREITRKLTGDCSPLRTEEPSMQCPAGVGQSSKGRDHAIRMKQESLFNPCLGAVMCRKRFFWRPVTAVRPYPEGLL